MMNKTTIRINECPHCKEGKGYIIDSRMAKSETGVSIVRRRRSCGQCNFRWLTYEIDANEYAALRANNAKIAYKLIQQFKIQILYVPKL